MYQRNDGRWVEKISIPGKGQKTFTGKTQKIVRQKMAEWMAEGEKGKRFDKIADEWDSWHSTQVTYNAHDVYAPMLKRAKEHFKNCYAKDITPDMVQGFINKISAKQYAKSTVQKHLNMMRMIFDYAITQPNNALYYNPCGAVRVPSGLSTTRREPPTDAQLAKIDAYADDDLGLFAYFLLYTGMRRGELLALRWEDIDRENKIIHVNKTVYYEGNNPHIKEPKTEAGRRDIDLLDVLAHVLPEGGKGYVFGGEKPLTKSAFRKGWIRLCRQFGLVTVTEKRHRSEGNKHEYVEHVYKTTVTPHQFRHAFASMLDDAGIDESGAKAILGHSSIVVTKDIYTHLRERKRERIGSTLNEYLKNNDFGA